MFFVTVGGVIQSFSINYTMLLVFEFMHAASAAVIYPAIFLLCMEWSGAQDRVFVSSVVAVGYPIGIAISGVWAAYTQHFRIILLYAFGSGLFFIALMLYSSESLRWLMVKGKEDDLTKVLKRAAKTNNRQLSSKTRQIIRQKCTKDNEKFDSAQEKDNECSLGKIFVSKTLVARFLINSFCWITGTFLVFGIAVTSVSLYGDKYVNFILVALGGIPGTFAAIFLLKYIGRRTCISASFIFTSAAIVGSKLVPKEYNVIGLLLFFTARVFSSIAFHTIYIHTSEMWPTPLRQTMMGLSSTLGRVGSILAPLTPLLVNIHGVIFKYS